MELNKQYVVKTNKKAIDIMDQVSKSKLKFANYGSFLLEFFLLETTQQMKLGIHLLTLSKDPKLNDYYVIKGFHKAGLSSAPNKWNIILDHSFKCIGCGAICDGKTNAFDGRLRDLCEMCEDRAREYEEEDESYRQYLGQANL